MSVYDMHALVDFFLIFRMTTRVDSHITIMIDHTFEMEKLLIAKNIFIFRLGFTANFSIVVPVELSSPIAF